MQVPFSILNQFVHPVVQSHIFLLILLFVKEARLLASLKQLNHWLIGSNKLCVYGFCTNNHDIPAMALIATICSPFIIHFLRPLHTKMYEENGQGRT